MSDLKLYSFPPIQRTDECEEFSNAFLTYPFFDENGNANPNLIGITAILSDDNKSSGICSYNYLCPYNIIATYDAYHYNPQGIEKTEVTEKAHKVIIDGQLRIVRGDKIFDATGRQL